MKWSHVSCKGNCDGGNDNLLVVMCSDGLFASIEDNAKLKIGTNITEDAFSDEIFENMVKQAEPSNNDDTIEKSEGSRQ